MPNIERALREAKNAFAQLYLPKQYDMADVAKLASVCYMCDAAREIVQEAVITSFAEIRKMRREIRKEAVANDD